MARWARRARPGKVLLPKATAAADAGLNTIDLARCMRGDMCGDALPCDGSALPTARRAAAGEYIGGSGECEPRRAEPAGMLGRVEEEVTGRVSIDDSRVSGGASMPAR